MDLKIARKPVSLEPFRQGAESTQVYRWPSILSKVNVIVPVLSALFAFASFCGIRSGVATGDVTRVVAGILGSVGCLMALALLGLVHFVAAREVRFTRDCLIIKQTGRRDLVLPYCHYQEDWVADLSNQDLVRVITFGGNRGCSIIFPPAWLHTALVEVARIQQEEGWYAPSGTSPA